MALLPILVPLLQTGCSTPPLFNQISSITVHNQTARGTHRQAIEGEDLASAAACLGQSQELESDPGAGDLLRSVILLEIEDRNGHRMFELYSSKNMKGNGGSYYFNDCIHAIVTESAN